MIFHTHAATQSILSWCLAMLPLTLWYPPATLEILINDTLKRIAAITFVVRTRFVPPVAYCTAVASHMQVYSYI